MSDRINSSIAGRIARTELKTLFCSPIAWFILIVFSVLTSVSFIDELSRYLSYVETSASFGDGSLTSYIYLGNFGFFQKVVGNLFIYIPLLTMGLIARETSSGSVKLAYSSPVTSVQYVAGKYMASAVMGLCLLAVPVLTVIGGMLFIPNFDIAPVLAALLGLYMLICVYSAIGLFMSSLTSYQVVAAVGTLAALAALGNINRLGPGYDLTRNITHWVSISGRTSSFLTGVLRTDDIIYFITIILLFLTLTVFRVSFPRRALGFWKKLAAYLSLAAAVVILAVFSTRPGLTGIYDVTRTKQNSITEGSKEVVRQIDGKITVNSYVNMLDNMSRNYLPTLFYQYRSLFEQYKLTKPDIEEHTIYYYGDSPFSIRSNPSLQGMSLDEARDYTAMIYTLNPRRYRSPEEMVGIKAVEDSQGAFVREIITADGRVEYLRDFNDMERTPSEAEITAVLAKFITELPAVGFMEGNGERSLSGSSLEDYGDFSVDLYSRYALVNQGFDIFATSFDTEIPENIRMIVIADPSETFSEGQMENYRKYLDRGGNLILLTDYDNRNVAAPLLAELGLSASDRQLAIREGDFAANLVLARGAGSVIPEFAGLAVGGRVTMPGCIALDTLSTASGFKKAPLLMTGDGAWLENDYSGFRDDIVSAGADNEDMGRFCTAYTITRMVGGKEQRIAVLGDADCFSNSEMTISREGVNAANFDLITRCFRWISDGRFPFEVRRDRCTDNEFDITTDQMPFIKAVYIFIIPLLMLLCAAFVLLSRRRN